MMFMSPELEQLRILEGWIGELTGAPQAEPDLPEIKAQPPIDAESGNAPNDAVSDLVIELMRTGVLDAYKGRLILQKLRPTNRGR